MALASMKELYVEELSDLLSAEKMITQALPKMAEAAHDETLRQAFHEHLQQTQEHVHRLEQVFELLGEQPTQKVCKAMRGIIEEGSEVLHEDGDQSVKDAALIAAAQRVEHYEMAGYGCVRTFAKLLGHRDQAKLLQTTLDEEGRTDEKLTQLAERDINEDAAQ